MPTPDPKVAVVGSGYWGKNLVRVFHELGALEIVCDSRSEALGTARSQYNVRTEADFDQVLADPRIDGVVIAVPAAQHFDLAKRALLRDKDVYVEKPLALHAHEGATLVELAAQRHKVLMVGHILEYHPAILRLKTMVSQGDLGKIQYIFSSRLNLGKLRTEENILWSFAPHDISAILFLLDEMPFRVATHGGGYINKQIPDTTLTTCEFSSGAKAHIFVSWLHPFKEQKLAVVGGKKMVVFDDVEKERKLVLYPHRIEWLNRAPVACRADGENIPIVGTEPLRLECEHFLECVRTRSVPRTSGERAVRVLQVLEACGESLRRDGTPVEVQTHTLKSYFAHETAVIDPGCQVGAGTKVWHFSHLMAGCTLGENCNLGQNVVVAPGVKIGNNVKIQNNVSVYTGVHLEDDVFCGPSMVFTNVVNPRSHVDRKREYKETFVKKGATIGANVTVVCGVTLGRYCFIGAGAVVTRDVPDYALMVGVPAERVGWVCYCGVRLPFAVDGEAMCTHCNRTYRFDTGFCVPVSEPRVVELPMKEIASTAKNIAA
jgi:UDP-2-acetamido-3-amino-2,3-dideoxy-glucuronate N-acetyltransferase